MNDKVDKSIAEQNQLVSQNIEKSILSKIVNSLTSSVIVLNESSDIVYFNKPLEQLINDGTILGRKLGQIFQCENEATSKGGCSTGKFCSACPFNLSLANSDNMKFEGFVRSQSMESIVVDVESQGIEIDGTKFSILLVNDLSEKKRKSLLDRTFFHDIGNNLTIVHGHLSILKSSYAGNKSINKLGEIFDKFKEEVAFQRHFLLMESDDLVATFKNLELINFASDILESFKNKATEKNVNIQFSSNTDSIIMQSDHTLLRRVIVNMIKNAIEASIANETVTLEVKHEKNQTIVSVANPKYMEHDVQAKVFSKFFSTKGQGRGLGTFSIKHFTEKYLGGIASFTSTQENGTKFQIVFNS